MPISNNLTGNRRVDLAKSKAWAQNLLSNPENNLILETDVISHDGPILGIVLRSLNSEIVFSQFIKPADHILEAIREEHSITDEMVANASRFSDVEPELRNLMRGKAIIAFDWELEYSRLAKELEHLFSSIDGNTHTLAASQANNWLSKISWHSVREHYVILNGTWDPRDRSYKDPKDKANSADILDTIFTIAGTATP